ncbi:(2Fe-2S)-binding protein [Halobacillus sp. HZG1]|uniref:(2Fe-2S)-binding protein n=1 Tax=Halobacillus sp. HZG1 TaxID=3111769 RepID=UPI002DB649ED|nr:(2Fe-2S)-binding protein [Halobacillus sp. HZG1]MEC3884855.1 (2Fe-2S)-binding protein [Halobacillus sp. HZG1]
MIKEDRKQVYDFLAKNAFIHIESDFDDKIDYRVSDIIENETNAAEFIQVQKAHRGTEVSTIVGTLFGKRYTVLAMGIFSLLIRRGIMIDTAPHLIGIKLEEGKPNRYFIEEEAVKEVSDLTTAQLHGLIRTFLKSHLEPLFSAVAAASRCKAEHLHSFVAHNLFQRRLLLMRQEQADEQTIDHYLNLFTTDELFGVEESNPLAFTFPLHKPEEGEPFYIREHCCLSYLLHDRDLSHCCGTCPHLFKSSTKREG